MFVVNKFTSPLMDVAEGTILIAKTNVVGDAYVMVHRNHPSRHRVIVDAMTPALLPTWPVSRLKFAYTSTAKTKKFAKMCVPRLK